VNLWPNQVEEAAMIARSRYAFLAADMGTGKSAAAIVGLQRCRNILIVCPIAVGPAWVKQLSLWDDTGREACLAVSGSGKQRAANIKSAKSPCVVIVNYDAAWRGEIGKVIMSRQWDAIVLDESHRVKSPSGRASRWLAKLAASQPDAKRVCLTGTPTPKDPLDWWAQFRFLDPTVLGGSYTAFRSRIAVMDPRFPSRVVRWRPEALQALSQRIDPHIYRIKADDVLTLPESIHIEMPVVLPPKSRKYYDTLEENLIAEIEESTVTAANKMVVVTRLQQATSGYAVDCEGKQFPLPGQNPKAAVIKDLLEDLPRGEPVVFFCKFIHDIQLCQSILDEVGISHSELSGRKKSLDQWQRGDTIALVVQQQAGGVGVDCTRAAYAVYVSLSHSLGDFEQSLARLRRPGQTRPCRFYHLVAEDTVDRAIYDALAAKRDVAESVLSRLTRRVPA
jgi:SNF2 family DNA or RNA helicase